MTRFSRLDGAVYPVAPGVAGGEFEPVKYSFTNLGVAEVQNDLETFIGKLRLVKPRARLILTVSPVPLGRPQLRGRTSPRVARRSGHGAPCSHLRASNSLSQAASAKATWQRKRRRRARFATLPTPRDCQVYAMTVQVFGETVQIALHSD